MARGTRRWPWILLGGTVLLAVAAVVLLPRVLDVERHRGRIEAALREATGWEPEIGAIELSVLRGLALRVSPAKLTSPDGESSVEVGSLAARAALGPLFRGRLDVRSLVLERPTVTLVRDRDDESWPLPLGAPRAEPAGHAAGDAAAAVSIGSIRIEGGSARLEDRTMDPPLRIELDSVGVEMRPAAGTVEGSARLAGDRGTLTWSGGLPAGLRLDLDAVDASVLAPWIGEGVVHPDARLSGRIDAELPLRLRARLEARSLGLATGERPLGDATIGFEVEEGAGGRLVLPTLEISSGGVRVSGSGEIAPALGVDLELPDTPLEPLLDVARAAFPVPLDARPPGSGRARVRIEATPAGETTLAATGEIGAASIVLGPTLPPATDVRCGFRLSPSGSLELQILSGRVGGGALEGVARVAALDPPGKLVFEGRLADAALGQLLAGMVDGTAERVAGATAIDARVELDLAAPALDVQAIGGHVGLDATGVTLPGWDLEHAIRAGIGERVAELGRLAEALDRPDLAARLAGTAEGAPSPTPLLEAVAARLDLGSRPWRLETLQLDAGGVTATGSGRFDPVAGRVEVEFAARLDGERSRELVERHPQARLLLDDGGRIALPLRIEGPFLAPTIRPDVARLERSDALEERARDEVRGLLEGLLERKRKKKEAPPPPAPADPPQPPPPS